jgi:hypothetical protein
LLTSSIRKQHLTWSKFWRKQDARLPIIQSKPVVASLHSMPVFGMKQKLFVVNSWMISKAAIILLHRVQAVWDL